MPETDNKTLSKSSEKNPVTKKYDVILG